MKNKQITAYVNQGDEVITNTAVLKSKGGHKTKTGRFGVKRRNQAQV